MPEVSTIGLDLAKNVFQAHDIRRSMAAIVSANRRSAVDGRGNNHIKVLGAAKPAQDDGI